jgi:hypothetical protein
MSQPMISQTLILSITNLVVSVSDLRSAGHLRVGNNQSQNPHPLKTKAQRERHPAKFRNASREHHGV